MSLPGIEPATELGRRASAKRRAVATARTIDCQPDVFPLDHEPSCQWTAGESNPDFLVAGQASSRWTSSPCGAQRSVRELNPVIRPTMAACCLPKHLQTKTVEVIPDGIEPSLSWLSPRRLRRWTTGSCVVSDRSESRTHRITRLSTSPLFRLRTRPFWRACPVTRQVAGPGVAPGSPSL